MSEIEKKPLSKLKSVPPPVVKKFKPSLLQTRRHSWFGASQEAPPDSPHDEPQLGIYDIQEEEETGSENQEVSASSSWWHSWSIGSSESSSAVRQRKSHFLNGTKVR